MCVYNLIFSSKMGVLNEKRCKERCSIYKEELIQKAYHTLRIQKYFSMGYEIDDLDNIL